MRLVGQCLDVVCMWPRIRKLITFLDAVQVYGVKLPDIVLHDSELDLVENKALGRRPQLWRPKHHIDILFRATCKQKFER